MAQGDYPQAEKLGHDITIHTITKGVAGASEIYPMYQGSCSCGVAGPKPRFARHNAEEDIYLHVATALHLQRGGISAIPEEEAFSC